VTQLRKRVLDELESRNYSQATGWSYVGAMRQLPHISTAPRAERGFSGKVHRGVKRSFPPEQAGVPRLARWLREPRSFARFLQTLHAHKWVVYVKKPFGGPEHVLHYLAHYTHRVAISNHRLLDMEDGKVTFRWKDYAHSGKQRKMTLAAEEFIRRFLLHVLPKGFVRIRQYGWMVNRYRLARVAECRALLAALPSATSSEVSGRRCSVCGGIIEVVEMILPRWL